MRLTVLIPFMCISVILSCSNVPFFGMSDSNGSKHFPGEPSGSDAISSSTNMSGKEGDTSPKLDALSGAVYLPPPQIGNYGSVNISYPVMVPQGRAGLSPSVGLSYSSSGGDGLVGIGWNLSTGLAVISRTTSNGELYYDYRDTFTFNGKRLVKTSGSATSEEGTYRCEIESDFSRFEMRSSSSGGVWHVYDKSGAVTVLGETTDARVYRPDNMNKTCIWNFSRAYDLNGNYMTASYDTSDYAEHHIPYIKEIRYTGNYTAGASARQFVRFNYKDRDDSYVSKSAGFVMRMTRILDSIVVGWDDPSGIFGSDRELWRYTMEYKTSEESDRPLLSSVDSTKHTTKPEFIYQKAIHAFTWKMIPNQWASDSEIDPDSTKYFEGDFNGDGISDMVFFNPVTGDWKAAEGTRGGGYTFRVYGNKFKGYDSPENIQFFKGNVTGDYNGDGRSDVAIYLPETREFIIAEHDGKVLQFRKYGTLPTAMGDIFACEWFTGDYDGNGLSDIMLFDERCGNWTLMCDKGGNFEFRIISTHFKNLFRSDYSPNSNLDSASTFDTSMYGLDRDRVQFFSGDYNGDGRTDIAVYDARSGKWYVGENYRNGSTYSMTWKLFKTFSAPESALFANERFCGDFNGDGFSDFLLFNRSTGEWVIGETDDGTITFKVWSRMPDAVRANDVTRWLQGDFNGDGRTDVGFYSKTDGNFWIGEAGKNGFRYRIYNNMSYGPDESRVMATPLPLDEVEIAKGSGVLSSGSATYAAEYSWNGNWHRGKGERAFPGFFSNSNTLSILLYDKDTKKYYLQNAGADPAEVTSLYGTDLDAVTVLNRSRAGKFRGATDSLLVYGKSNDTHVFSALDPTGKTRIAEFPNTVLPFSLSGSVYAVDFFTGGAASLLALDDGTGMFSRVSGTTVNALSFGSTSVLAEDYFRNLSDRRSGIRILHGRFGSDSVASVILVDQTGSSPSWYKGTVSGNVITFSALAGTSAFISPSIDELDYNADEGGITYALPSGNGYAFHRITLGASVKESVAEVANISFSNGYDAQGNPVVSREGETYSAVIGDGGTVNLKTLSPVALSFARNDLMTKVYPFQWIQGDYNGDGKTDIGIFHLKESKWYFAVTTGTVPDMLSKVKNGIGGTYEFEYENSTKFDNTGDDGLPHLPMNYKVCTRLTVDDGFGRRVSTQYEYAGGYAFSGFVNGKKETDYFGFSEFTVRDALGGRTVNTYNTVPYDDFRKNRALAGAVKTSRMIGSDNREYARTEYTYTLHEITESTTQSPSYLIEPTKVETYRNGVLFETKESNIQLASGKYELVSKTESSTDHFSDGVHSPVKVSAYSEFSYDESTNETRLVYKREFTGTKREVRTDYLYDAKGNLTREMMRYTGSGLSKPKDRVMRYGYDTCGNRTRSVNESDSPYRITETTYDGALHQYAVETRAVGGIVLSTKYEINYDSAFGAAQKKTDPNGWSVYYDFDKYGRLAKQRLDTDSGTETLAEYVYYDGGSSKEPPSNGRPLTAKVTQYTGDGDEKETRVYCDGLGRTLQSVWSATEESGKKYAKSGLVTYDAVGRVIRTGQTQWAGDGDIDEYTESRELNPTVTEYDAIGRVSKVTLPPAKEGESPTYTEYAYNDPWETTVTHSIGRSKRTVKNARGLVLYVEDSGTGDDGKRVTATMGFAYDEAGYRVKKMDLNGVTMNLNIDNALFAPGKKDVSGNNVAQWKYDGFGQLIESSDPDLGYTKAEYDGFGGMTARTDARGLRTTMTYDAFGRLTGKALPGDEGAVRYVYDEGQNAKGKLTAIDDPAQVKRLEYDRIGRVSHEEREIKGVSTVFETDFTYDLLNRTKTIQYPLDPVTDKRITTEYRYCAYGVTGIRITQGIFRNKDVIESVTYNEFGQMESIARGNDTLTTYTYDIRGRLEHLVTKKGGQTLQDVKYDFRTDNSIQAKEDSFGENDAARKVRYEYNYDGLNRLADASGEYLLGTDETKARRFHHGYSYSQNGNMTGKTQYDTATNTVEDRWTYAYNNHAVSSIHSGKSGNRFEMAYDAAGNMIQQEDAKKKIMKEMEYDSSNRITKVTDPNKGKLVGEYWYDDQGFRVRKVAAEIVNGAEAKVEVLYPSMYFAIEMRKDSKGNDITDTAYACNNIYMNGIRVAASLPNGECQYYLTDQVDSVSIVSDNEGKVVTRTEYLPYGETWIQEGETRNRPKYNSQELDAETGYYFYNARYYDPEICRFVTADNVIDGEYDTQGWNRFSYCHGNPIVYKDPTGHGVGGGIVGGVICAPFGPVGSGLGAYWGSKIQDYLTRENSKESALGTNTNVQSQRINRAPDNGAVPGRINGPKQSNEVICKLSEDIGQDNGKGNAILREMFGNDFKKNEYCQTNSVFLGLAKLGCVEPTVEGYKKFIQYATSKDCPWDKGKKCVDKANGNGNDLWEIAKDYGANYDSARKDYEKALSMYKGFLSDGDDNQVALVHNGEHCVASSPMGGRKDYAYDTGESKVRGKTQYDRTKYSIDEGRKIYNTIIMTKK